MKKGIHLGLLPKVLLAMALGIACSWFFPMWLMRVFFTFNAVFSNFLNFAIPLIIIGLVAPGIAELGRGAGRLLGLTALLAYLSTVLAGFGMILYLQNIGNLSTYSAHSQVGMFCIAALLVGGASVDRASIGNVFLGVILFHTMFIVAPKAGAMITGDSMIGEYFRVFISYGVITLSLILYETKKRKSKSLVGQQLAQAQKDEEEKA